MNEHIPTAEILQDIQDTRAEIETYKREVIGLRLMGDRMSHFRADARVSGIREREVFIVKLEAMIAERDSRTGEGE